jgi:hypothetical protein
MDRSTSSQKHCFVEPQEKPAARGKPLTLWHIGRDKLPGNIRSRIHRRSSTPSRKSAGSAFLQPRTKIQNLILLNKLQYNTPELHEDAGENVIAAAEPENKIRREVAAAATPTPPEPANSQIQVHRR